MILNLKGFSQLIEDMGAALQSSASNVIDVSVGSVVRAIFEANASVVLWLQWLLVQVLQSTRASTSSGPDLDSWMLDFGLTRLPAIASTGIVTFSRFTTNLPATLPVGTLVKTTDGSLSFSVTEDQSISIWQASSSAYILPSGVVSADVPVVCTSNGMIGNVLTGSITIIAASLPGIDLVYNANPCSNGADPEDDQAFRGRFQGYIASRSRATLVAVQNAVANVRQCLNVSIMENTDSSGNPETGSFLVVLDDGTGYPSADLLSMVASAVDAVRPIGTRFSVIAPGVLVVSVTMSAGLISTAIPSQIIASIRNHVASYLDALPIAAGASITRVAQSAYLAGSTVINISNVELNGLATDIVVGPLTVIKSGQITVTVNGG
jgi:hypothetical protein